MHPPRHTSGAEINVMAAPVVLLWAGLVAAACGPSTDHDPDATPPSDHRSPTVFASVYSHNEDDERYDMLRADNGKDPTEQIKDYKNYRSSLIALAKMVNAEGAAFNFQPEFVFLEAARRFELDAADTSELFASSNGKNILRYLHEDLNTMVDPHSHEACGRNKADVAYLISLFGVEPTGVVGGFLMFAPTPSDLTWEKFRAPLASSYYPGHSWQATTLWGGAKVHTDGGDKDVEEVVFSGIYRPKSQDAPLEHDPDGNLLSIGTAGWGFDAFLRLSDELATQGDASKIYTYTLPCFEYDIYDEVFGKKSRGDTIETSTLLEKCRSQIRQMTTAGGSDFRVVWQHLDKVAETWKKDYLGAANLLIVPPAHGARSTGKCGDGTCDATERQSGLCRADCPV